MTPIYLAMAQLCPFLLLPPRPPVPCFSVNMRFLFFIVLSIDDCSKEKHE